jgi:hypothetical protein
MRYRLLLTLQCIWVIKIIFVYAVIHIGLHTGFDWQVEYKKQLQAKSATAFLPYKQVDVIKDTLPTSINSDTCGSGYCTKQNGRMDVSLFIER